MPLYALYALLRVIKLIASNENYACYAFVIAHAYPPQASVNGLRSPSAAQARFAVKYTQLSYISR